MFTNDDLFRIADDEAFDAAALETFRFQAERCAPYRRYLDLVGIRPEEIRRSCEIPHLPIGLFKTHDIYCGDAAPEAVFTSSSTTGMTPSRHPMRSLALYEQAFRASFRTFYGEPARWSLYALLPNYLRRKGSSLVYMADRLIGDCGSGGFYLDDYERLLAPGTHHLSTIPNTPVSVGEGIIVCERRHSLSDAEWQAVRELFGRIGLVPTVDTAQLSAAGTICGCGPAFIALSIEALADAAVKHGIARDEAYRMVSQMVVGTGRLQLESGEHPGRLKDQVCSPGGTTIRGVAELERRGLRGALIDAVDAIEGR